MKKIIEVLSILFFLISTSAYALDVPVLKGRVNDYAGILQSDALVTLEQKLANYEATTSTQIAILTVPSLGGEVISQFSMRVAEAWKIGQKGKDNGILITIAKEDHKMRIEVGYGLEGKVTDMVADQIIRNYMAPEFKKGNFAGGINSAIDQIALAAKGEFKNDSMASDETSAGIKFGISVAVLFIVSLFLSSLNNIFSGIVGAICLPGLAYIMMSAGLLAIIILAVIGFIVCAFPLEIVNAALSGDGYSGSSGSSGGGNIFSGGGGSFGGGGADGDC